MGIRNSIFATSIGLCLLFLGLGVFSSATAQDGTVTDDDVNRVAQQLFCPTCESVPVDVCPTQVCSDWPAAARLRFSIISLSGMGKGSWRIHRPRVLAFLSGSPQWLWS